MNIQLKGTINVNAYTIKMSYLICCQKNGSVSNAIISTFCDICRTLFKIEKYGSCIMNIFLRKIISLTFPASC